MITGISHITRYVQDAEAALRFYTEVLGFQKCADMEVGPGMRWLTVQAPGQTGVELVLFEPRVWLKDETQLAQAEGMLDHQPQLVFATEDIDAALVRLKDAGVQLDTPEVRDLPWGRDLEFRDLTGSSINLVQAKPMPVFQ
ncbi:VOC family protein [Deinococcus cellulosilyticus]|uniref:Lyase n=1 Tax=Deinococcus cellulosilyticus (strain DSM 18568 / NBRC 106333 / KACC 11606 / 5516J-15) TaxID=1223518 RepID=A0A511N387_DEIC1|nr:VOC family protein [Deinococcus cellulosilyticus]GEM47325.1 lyase [Deinococcus cellulosilyticus NBRC 106333 = KACC 11606]